MAPGRFRFTPSGSIDLALADDGPFRVVHRARTCGPPPSQSAVHSLEGRCKGTPPFTPAGSLRAERSSSLRGHSSRPRVGRRTPPCDYDI